MTPEQLQQYVESALKQRDNFLLVFYPLVVLLSVGGAWLFAYLREKGRNLATKEDIEAITRTQEQIKSELATRSHFSRLRYEREIEIYRDVWKKLFDFYESTTKLRFGVAHESPALREWTEKRNDLVEVIRYNRSFYPKEIWSELQTAQILCEEAARAKEHPTKALEIEPNNWVELKEKLQSQKDKVAEAIRERLSKFDGA